MAWSKAHKSQTREAIVTAAAELFTRLGYERVGINDVMAAAGLTRGAFYAHFVSKSALYAEAISVAAVRAKNRVLQGASVAPSASDIAERYLSRERADGGNDCCPLAFLATDIYQRDEQVRHAYAHVFKGFVRNIARADSRDEQSDVALQAAVLMVGGLAVARALTDDPMSDRIMEVCKQAIANLPDH
ncbi:TetR/AcrR family transcriptional regulator [Gilvimarinus polysaccharolyticus]|uniref:TetR/AcrR family transcriptional regulator n=1 Tax=Gilvimarinus polysaccharolyticus TaxID=863921 RepID=UPI000673A5A9|nr:TetR/AcrR family transcriptional regulator [Gilvimarinus polysaccharolyticus]